MHTMMCANWVEPFTDKDWTKLLNLVYLATDTKELEEEYVSGPLFLQRES